MYFQSIKTVWFCGAFLLARIRVYDKNTSGQLYLKLLFYYHFILNYTNVLYFLRISKKDLRPAMSFGNTTLPVLCSFHKVLLSAYFVDKDDRKCPMWNIRNVACYWLKKSGIMAILYLLTCAVSDKVMTYRNSNSICIF